MDRSFPAVTVCTDQKQSGYNSYVSETMPKSERHAMLSALDVTTFGNYTFTPLEYSKFLALFGTTLFRKFMVTQSRFLEFLNPKASQLIPMSATLNRRFLKNANRKLYDMTNFNKEEVLTSCIFNLNQECLDGFVEYHTRDSCFSFNTNGSEKVNTALAGLEVTLHMDLSESIGTAFGTRAFTVDIHEPGLPPQLDLDGIPFETGRLTTVRVKRHIMNRISTQDSPCNDSEGYSKEVCIHECVVQKCLAPQATCALFVLEQITKEQLERNITGFETDLCYLSAGYSYGADASENKIYQVQDLNHIYLLHVFELLNSVKE